MQGMRTKQFFGYQSSVHIMEKTMNVENSLILLLHNSKLTIIEVGMFWQIESTEKIIKQKHDIHCTLK